MPAEFDKIKSAIQQHGAGRARFPGVIKVQPGYEFINGKVTDQPVIEVLVKHKLPTENLPADAVIPKQIGGVRVDVRQASVDEQLELAHGQAPEAEPDETIADLAEATGVVDDRTPIEQEIGAAAESQLVEYEEPDFEMEPVSENIDVTLHASPDAGFPQLKEFLSTPASHLSAQRSLSSKPITFCKPSSTASATTARWISSCTARGENHTFAQKLKDALGNHLKFLCRAAARKHQCRHGRLVPNRVSHQGDHQGPQALCGSQRVNWKESKSTRKGSRRKTVQLPHRSTIASGTSSPIRPSSPSHYERLVTVRPQEGVRRAGGRRSGPEARSPVLQSRSSRRHGEADGALSLRCPSQTRELNITPLISPDNFIKEIPHEAQLKKATTRLHIQESTSTCTRPPTAAGGS